MSPLEIALLIAGALIFLLSFLIPVRQEESGEDIRELVDAEVKKRVELITKNREHDKKYGKASRSGKDLSHTSSGLVYKKRSVNRGSKSDMPGDRRARGGK